MYIFFQSVVAAVALSLNCVVHDLYATIASYTLWAGTQKPSWILQNNTHTTQTPTLEHIYTPFRAKPPTCIVFLRC